MHVQCSTEVVLYDMSYVNLLLNFKSSKITYFKRQIMKNV